MIRPAEHILGQIEEANLGLDFGVVIPSTRKPILGMDHPCPEEM